MKNKKGLSPFIATVLLIAIVIIIALIIFFWFRGFNEEVITKFQNKNVKLVCGDVSFEAEYNNEMLLISNTGSVPIYDFNIQIKGAGSHITETLKSPLTIGVTNWPSFGLNQGQAFSSSIIISASKDEIILIPILIGSSKKGESIYECEEQYGSKITL